MWKLGGGLGSSIVAVGGGLVAGALVAVAAVAPIDFTGHWTGTATGKGSPVTLVADLTSSGRMVTGTLDATQDGQQPQTCTVNGKQHGRFGFRATLTPCKVALKGKFNASTNTISGHYVAHGHHKVQTGTFMLTRGASPSGAFLDPTDVR